MKLDRLECDNPGFKTLEFCDGLNIVVGLQLSESEKKTYNGIGKSLSLKLIHLMLGAKLDDQQLKLVLQNYGTFTLSFSHDGKEHRVSKNFGRDVYVLDGKPLHYGKYRDELTNEIIAGKVDLSFRELFKAFARQYGGSYYVDALTQQGMAISDFNQRLVNFILLKIDTSLVLERKRVKGQIAKLDQAKAIVEEYEAIVENRNTNDLVDLRNQLTEAKDKFQISKNYDEIKNKADTLTAELNVSRDRLYAIEVQKRNKERLKKLIEENDVEIKDVVKIYAEALFFFSDEVVKRLKDVKEFHKRLTTQRYQRLTKEIEALESQLSLLSREIDSSAGTRDGLIRQLENSGALEEYFALIERIKNLDEQIAESTKYREVVNSFKIDKSKLAVTNTQIKEKSLIYIADTIAEFGKKETIFRDLVKRFYGNSGGSLSLKETADAKYLYDIKIEVPKEKSQGVGEVKIFCYDLLLYLLNTDLLGFVAHDGCLYSEMDPRQKAMMVKIILELCDTTGLQYFVNMNQNTFEEVRSSSLFNEEEKNRISKSVILQLFDLDPKSTLLGISY